MADYSELKRLAEAAQEDPNSPYLPCPVAFMNAATPSVVLSLIAETEELGRYLCTCRDCGGEGSLHTGDWHSYSSMEPPEPVMEKCGECDGTGLLGEIQDLYQVITERDQLRAQVAGLKTGYEAYERVNAELKAEVEESASVIDKLAKILAGVVVALKGEELPLRRHGYHDLVECAAVLKLENDLRMADNEALRNLLLEASEEIDTWGAYASPYFQEKHDLAGCVAKFHSAAMGKGEQS